MSYKCGECGLVNWSGEPSCKSCGAAVSPDLSGGTYAPGEAKEDEKLACRPPIRSFCKALFISVIVEIIVLLVTGAALVSSMMRHSGGAPRPRAEGFLAALCLIYHFPSIVILMPFNLFIFAPLVQIALMTIILRLVFRAREA